MKPVPQTESEHNLIASLLREVVPERHISNELISEFLATYREGQDITHFLLDRVAQLIRRIDADLTYTEQGAEALRAEVQSLEQVTADLKSSFNELALLDEMVSAERRHRTLEDVLESFIDLAGRALPLSGARVFIIDPQSHAFVPRVSRTLRPAQEQETDIRLEEGTFAWAIREGGAIVMPVAMPPEQGRTLVLVPMVLDRRPLGVACLFSGLADAEFTPQHFQILRSLVHRASLSIDHAARIQSLADESSRVAAMKDYLHLIVDNLVQAVIVVDAGDRVTLFNRTAEIIFGLPGQEIVGNPYADALPEDLSQVLEQLLARTRRDDPVVDYEFGFDRGEGVRFRLGVTSAPVRDPEGQAGGVVLTFRDLFTARELMRLRRQDEHRSHTIDQVQEDLREAQERLRRSEKLASIGQMAAGVAHEINNPLGSIAGFIQILMMDADGESSQAEYLTAMQKEVERMRGIVEDLLDFSRQQPREAEAFLPVDVNLLVEETLRFVEPQARVTQTSVETHFTPDLPPIFGLADRLKQVVLNIALNAFAALNKESNQLTVTTRGSTEDGRTWVEIDLADNGEGIRRENLPRIFDPFFTTREQGQGTGLGLSTCYAIIEQHGGEIRVDSVWGEGTTFTIRLPAQQAPEPH